MDFKSLEHPIIAVDVVIFKMIKNQLVVLLHKRPSDPFVGAWALPGVAVRLDETLMAAAKRALITKTHLENALEKGIYLEQLATFDALYRDSRGRTISIAFLGIVAQNDTTDEHITWRPVEEINKGSLPFDHEDIIDTALNRLQGKLRYTNIAQYFLPGTFRIEALQNVYESILGHPINRTNFRNKFLKIGLIRQVKVLNAAVGKKGGRPPHLYCFNRQELEVITRDFL